MARRFLRVTLERWQIPTDTVESAVLMTSEALTNAIVHARPPVSLVVRTDDDLRVEVHDGDPDHTLSAVETAGLRSLIHEPDLTAENGRGLAMIAVLAARWGIVRAGQGKVIWFTLDLPAAW